MERRAFFPRLMMAIDAVVVAAAFVLSYYLRRFFPGLGLMRLGPLEYYLWVLLAAIPIWWVLLLVDGGYALKAEPPRTIIWRGLKVGTIGLLLLSLLLLLLNFKTFNRSLMILFIFAATILLIASRMGLSWWLAFQWRRGKSSRHALIVTVDDPDSRQYSSLLVERMQDNPAEGTVPWNLPSPATGRPKSNISISIWAQNHRPWPSTGPSTGGLYQSRTSSPRPATLYGPA